MRFRSMVMRAALYQSFGAGLCLSLPERTCARRAVDRVRQGSECVVQTPECFPHQALCEPGSQTAGSWRCTTDVAHAARARQDTKDGHSLLDPDFVRRIGFAERTTDLEGRYTSTVTQRGTWQSLTGGIVSCLHEEDNKAAARSTSRRATHSGTNEWSNSAWLCLPSKSSIKAGHGGSCVNRWRAFYLPRSSGG